MNIEATDVIDRLSDEIGKYVKENVILKIQIDKLMNENKTLADKLNEKALEDDEAK